MNKKATISIIVLLIILLIASFFILTNFVLANGDLTGTTLDSNKIDNYYFEDYKFQNYSDMLIAAEKSHRCEYKPDKINDGYKICSPEIIFFNKKETIESFNMIKDNIGFVLTKDYRDRKLDMYYSIDYSIITEERFNMTTTNCKGGNNTCVPEKEYYNVSKYEFTNWKEFDGSQKILSTNNIVGIKLVFELPQYEKAFYNFTYTPLNYLLDPDVSECGTLSTAGGIYTQTANITDNSLTGPCIDINNQNITFNGNGYTINSNDNQPGIYSDQDNSTIINSIVDVGATNVNGFGVRLAGATNGIVYNNSLNSSFVGIYAADSDNMNITLNTIGLDGYGIYLSDCNNFYIADNTISNNTIALAGITLLDTSSSNKVINNIIKNSAQDGIYMGTTAVSQNLISQNTIIDNVYAGIELGGTGSNYNNITNNNITNNKRGVFFFSNLNYVKGNTIGFSPGKATSSNSYRGIALESGASYNTFEWNNISHYGPSGGISIEGTGNNLSNNNASHAALGMSLNIAYYSNVVNTSLYNNTLSHMLIVSSYNNTIENLDIVAYNDSAQYSLVELKSSSHNLFKNGNFQGNVSQVINLTQNSINNTFLNCTYNISKETISTNSFFLKKWYFIAQVNYTHNGTAVISANVTAYNSTWNFQDSKLANTVGKTGLFTLTEYINNNTKIYQANYTINISKTNWVTLNKSWNITGNIYNATFNITENNTPVSTASAILNITGATYTFNTWTNGSINVSINAVDTESGVDTTIYPRYCVDTLNSCAPNAFIGLSGKGISTEGVSYIRYYSNDTLNNLETTNSQTIKIDTTLPAILIITPTNLTNSTDKYLDINFTFSDGGSGISSCWYSNDTLTGNTTLANCNNITTVTWVDGPHNVTIWVNDSLNNINKTAVQFTIDTTNPNATLIFPLNNTYNSSTSQNFTFNASDNLGIKNSTLFIYNTTGSFNQTITSFTSNTLSQVVGIVVTLTEGAYKWWVQVWDWAGNTESAQNKTLIIDITYPLVNITSPINNTNTTSTQLGLNYTATDTNRDSCWYTRNGGTTNTTLASCANITGVTWYEGLNNITVWSNDSANNQNHSSITFRLDTISPSINITYPRNNTNYSLNTLDVNFSFSDGGSGISSCWYSNDTMTQNSTLANCGNITSLIWDEGEHNVTIWVNDTVNNVNLTTIKFFIDSVYPIVSYGSDTSVDYSNLSQLSIFVNVSWVEANFANVTFYLWNDTANINTTIYTTNTTYINWSLSTNRNYTYQANVSDNVNNINSSGVRRITLDTTNPNATLIFPLNNTYNSSTSQNFTFNLTDNLGVKNATLFIYNNTGLFNQTNVDIVSYTTVKTVGIVVVLVDNAYKWWVQVWDWAGNTESAQNKTITIDTIYPVINITYPINKTNTTNTQIDINFTRSDINLDSCWYTRNGGTTNTTLASCANITGVTWYEGLNNITVWSNDSANNQNHSSITFRLDTTAPTLTILSPINGAAFAINTIELNYSVSDGGAGLDTCWYRNNTDNTNHTIACGTNATIYQGADGTFTIYIWANDSLNNVASKSNVWSISTTSPIINLNYPGINKFFNSPSNIGFNFTPFHVNGLSTCELWGNWTGTWHKNQTLTTITNNSINNFTALNLIEGNGFIWNVWCNDSTGLVNGWATLNRTFNIDTTYPIINLTYPSNSSYNYILSSMNYSRSDLNLESCWYSTDAGANNVTRTDCSNITSLTASQSSNTWLVGANDSANNRNFSIRTFFVDSIIPNINFTAPTETNNSYLNRSYIHINVTATDTNLRNITIFLYNKTSYLNQSNISGTSSFYINYTNLVDGIYYFNATANDSLHNQNYTETRKVTIDTTYPIVVYSTGMLGNDTNTTDTSIFVNVTVTEINEDTITFLLHNATGRVNSTSYTDNTRTITWSNLIDGVYTFNVTVNDSAGLINFTYTYILRLDDTKPTITIHHPSAINYGNNNTIQLNYTATDNVVGLLQCAYYVYYTNGTLAKSTEVLSTCQNDTFGLPGGDNDFTLTLLAEDLLSNIQSSSVTFGIRTISPVVTLTTQNATDYNSPSISNNHFNFTVTTSADNISNCSLYGNWTTGWHLNQTRLNPPETSDNNFSALTLSEGVYIWNVLCADNFAIEGWALTNYTYIVDLTKPTLNVTSITTSTGSQTFTFNTSVEEWHSVTCKYTLFNSTGGIDGIYNNISVTCNANSTSATVSEYGTFNLTLYARDKAGNENSTTKTFTTSASSGGGGGGGGGGGTQETKIVEIIVPSNRTYCGDGICQKIPPGNDAGIIENFYSCSQDCPPFNVDSTIFYCFDEDPKTECIWEQLSARYVGLFMGILIVLLSFATVEEPKTKKQISLFKYTKNRFKKNQKIKNYRKI